MNMKKYLLWMAAATLLSCASSDEVELGESKHPVNMVSDIKPISLTPEQRTFVADNNGFTMNFLKTVSQTDRSGQSFIYSPLSITYVLGMVNDAATGTTEQELEQTLGFHEGGIQAVNDYCRNLIDNLPKTDPNVQLNIANAIFVNKNKATLKAQYQQDMLQYYNAKAEALDFKSPETLDHINGWANENTKGMIPSILDQVDNQLVSYLLNAIYFKADWASKFDEKNTRKETFTTTNGSTKFPMMHQKVFISYLRDSHFSAIQIPYSSGLWNMIVILPEEGTTTDDVIANLSDRGVTLAPHSDFLGDFSTYEVDLKLPRYETSSDTNDLPGNGLIGILKEMGINLAFDCDQAEIPNMCENGNVFINMMRQKARIKVNEEGLEAAAVTVGGFELTSYTPQPTEIPMADFHANRPFIYLIRESSSGAILFVGQFTGSTY